MNSGCGDQAHPAALGCLGTLVGNGIHTALLFIGPVTVILIVIAGYQFATSGGDSKQLEGARKTITFAVIGLGVVAFSYLILNVIATVTGVKCILNLNPFDSCK